MPMLTLIRRPYRWLVNIVVTFFNLLTGGCNHVINNPPPVEDGNDQMMEYQGEEEEQTYNEESDDSQYDITTDDDQVDDITEVHRTLDRTGSVDSGRATSGYNSRSTLNRTGSVDSGAATSGYNSRSTLNRTGSVDSGAATFGYNSGSTSPGTSNPRISSDNKPPIQATDDTSPQCIRLAPSGLEPTEVKRMPGKSWCNLPLILRSKLLVLGIMQFHRIAQDTTDVLFCDIRLHNGQALFSHEWMSNYLSDVPHLMADFERAINLDNYNSAAMNSSNMLDLHVPLDMSEGMSTQPTTQDPPQEFIPLHDSDQEDQAASSSDSEDMEEDSDNNPIT